MLFTLALVQSACSRCSAGAPLARLTQRQGAVERDLAVARETWRSAEIGAQFVVGDAVRTHEAASAELLLDDGSRLRLEAQTLIRFVDREPGTREQALDLVMGSASVDASEAGALLRTSFGLARLDVGARLKLSRSANALRYQVLVGAAHVESGDGQKLDLARGQIVEVALGRASFELVLPEEASSDAAQQAAETAVDESGEILATVRGSTVSVRAPGESKLSPMKPGSVVVVAGSVLSLGAGSQVVVTRGTERAELGAGGDYVVGSGGQLVETTSGSVTVTAPRMARIKVPGGFISVRAGSATVQTGRDGTSAVEASAGAVELFGRTHEVLTTGESGTLTKDGIVSIGGRGLSRSDVDVTVGQGLVIHDPLPPTAVGFLFGSRCPGAGIVRLSGPKGALVGGEFARGAGTVILPLGPGRVQYRLFCADADGKEGAEVAAGALTVLHDAGTKSVPLTAPSTSVEVNGRAYTVFYQNQLPQVTARWSNAPSGVGVFQVHLSGVSKRKLTATRSTYTFASGALGEGTHTIYFEGGGRVSRRSSVTIGFDNAAPTAALQTPATTGVGPGGSLNLAGIALPGWTVTVDGKSVGQDAEGRFAVTTTMPSSGRPAAVELTHSSRGTHLYLRRPAGTP